MAPPLPPPRQPLDDDSFEQGDRVVHLGSKRAGSVMELLKDGQYKIFYDDNKVQEVHPDRLMLERVYKQMEIEERRKAAQGG